MKAVANPLEVRLTDTRDDGDIATGQVHDDVAGRVRGPDLDQADQLVADPELQAAVEGLGRRTYRSTPAKSKRRKMRCR